MATLRADPARIPAAVEEMLRLDAPVQMFQRRANRDVELGGQRIERGDMAVVIYASANRDPAHWRTPDAFRLDRRATIELDRSRPLAFLPQLMTRSLRELPLLVSAPTAV